MIERNVWVKTKVFDINAAQFATTAYQKWLMGGRKSRPKFGLFDLCKIQGGVVEMSLWILRV